MTLAAGSRLGPYAIQAPVDGHHILVSTEERHGIDLLDTGSGESRVLFPGRARFSQTWAISPDERSLFVNRATEQADIWLATLE